MDNFIAVFSTNTLFCFCGVFFLRTCSELGQIWEECKEHDCENMLDLSLPGNLLRAWTYNMMYEFPAPGLLSAVPTPQPPEWPGASQAHTQSLFLYEDKCLHRDMSGQCFCTRNRIIIKKLSLEAQRKTRPFYNYLSACLFAEGTASVLSSQLWHVPQVNLKPLAPILTSYHT